VRPAGDGLLTAESRFVPSSAEIYLGARLPP